MNILRWLVACLIVYMRRLIQCDGAKIIKFCILAVLLLLAAEIGRAATIFLLIVAVLVFPALNKDVKQEIDEEYTRRK